MNRLDNPNNPCIDRLMKAQYLYIRRIGKGLCLVASFEVKPWGMYYGLVSQLEKSDA